MPTDTLYSSDWKWSQFTMESGLPSNSVYQVFEASDSSIWAVTARGLAQFDGFEWKLIELEKGTYQEVSSTIIGNYRNGILINSGNRYYYCFKRHAQEIPISPQLGCAVLENEKIVFVSKTSLYYYNADTRGTVELFPEITHGKVERIYSTRTGVWVRLNDGLYRLTSGSISCKLHFLKGKGSLDAIAENTHGTGYLSLRIPYQQRGLWEWQKYGMLKCTPHEQYDFIKSIDIDDEDNVIILYPYGDLRLHHRGTWSTLSAISSKIKQINSIRFRRNGDLWVCSENGLFLYRSSTMYWEYLQYPSPDLRNHVNEILCSSNNKLCIGTGAGLIIHEQGKSTQYINNISDTSIYAITGICEDKTGNLWVSSGSSFRGAFVQKGINWRHISIAEGSQDAFFHKIRKDNKGNLWFLGLGELWPLLGGSQPGAFEYRNGKFIRWGEQEGLINGRVYDFSEGKNGEYWFATYSGISRWKPDTNRTGRWTHWTTNQGLFSNRVLTLAIDGRNRLWFGHGSGIIPNGLGYIDEQDSIQYLSTFDGLCNNNINDLTSDEDGNIWAATQHGLCKYDGTSFINFDDKSGLSEVNLLSVTSSDSVVYVGTQGKGVGILSRDIPLPPPPKIFINQPIIENDRVFLRWRLLTYYGEQPSQDVQTRIRLSNGSWSGWSTQHEIVIPGLHPGDYRVIIQAKNIFGIYDTQGSAITFTIPDMWYYNSWFLISAWFVACLIIALVIALFVRKYRYHKQILASEAKFRAVTEKTSSAIIMFRPDFSIVFGNAGMARLSGFSTDELLAKNITDLLYGDSKNVFVSLHNELQTDVSQPSRAELAIRTAGGETRWVDLTWGWDIFDDEHILIGTAFDITERKLADERIQTLARELSNTERLTRRKLASFVHDTIGHELAISKMKLEQMQKKSTLPSLQETFEEIQALLYNAIQQTRAITFELSPPILYDLGLSAAIEWLVGELQKKHSIDAHFHHQTGKLSLPNEIRDIIFDGTKEAIMNIIKHAEATVVHITLSCESGQLIVTIHDNGRGFDTTIFDQYQAEKKSFGLFNLRERLHDIGGQLTIESEPEKGTIVQLRAPLK